MKVKTKVGEIQTPELSQIAPRTKYWVEALQDLVRVEDLYCVMGAALEEAYHQGNINAVLSIKFGKREVVDAEDWRIVETDPEDEAPGPEPAQPDVPSAGSGPLQQPAEASDVSGRPAESPGGEQQHEAEVEEGPRT